MSSSQPEPAPEQVALRRTHIGVLGALLLCAVAIAAGGFGGEEPPPSPFVTSAAIGLGLATIVTRQLGASPMLGPNARLFFGMGALLVAGCLGLLGVYMAYALASPQSGILFTLAGLIFTARPPVRRRGR